MDQFRGYTVAGMVLVNFVGGLAAFPEVLKHHNGHPYFSYADTIMPELPVRRRVLLPAEHPPTAGPRGPAARTYGHIASRSLGLILISLVMYAHEDLRFPDRWSQVTPEAVGAHPSRCC